MNLSKIQITLLSIMWLAIDLVTKHWIEGKSYFINHNFSLRMFKRYPVSDLTPYLSQYSHEISIYGSILSLIIMAYFYTQYYNRITLISIGMIMAGIIGNLIDNLYFGFCRTFIDFHYNKLLMFFDTPQFPIFNVADTLIVLGALLFIFNKKW